jgi:Holliday junction resolvase
MGRIFERELKGILRADEDMLARVTKTCSDTERNGYMRIRERPFMVVRAAGSLGVDLVALSADLSLTIEVKSSVSDVLRFSRNEKLVIQVQEMIDECGRVGLVPLYAFRYKRQRGDAWRIFTPGGIVPTCGRQKLLYDKLPKISPSREGNLIMRWQEGMPLSEFIDYITFVTTSQGNRKKREESDCPPSHL